MSILKKITKYTFDKIQEITKSKIKGMKKFGYDLGKDIFGRDLWWKIEEVTQSSCNYLKRKLGISQSKSQPSQQDKLKQWVEQGDHQALEAFYKAQKLIEKRSKAMEEYERVQKEFNKTLESRRSSSNTDSTSINTSKEQVNESKSMVKGFIKPWGAGSFKGMQKLKVGSKTVLVPWGKSERDGWIVEDSEIRRFTGSSRDGYTISNGILKSWGQSDRDGIKFNNSGFRGWAQSERDGYTIKNKCVFRWGESERDGFKFDNMTPAEIAFCIVYLQGGR